MIDVNVNFKVKVPGLKKLSDIVASGIGSIAGSLIAPWLAKQQVKAKRIETIGKADSLRIIAQAQADARQALTSHDVGTGTLEITPEQITQRLKFQEHKRHRNIVSVVREAAEEIGDEEVEDHEPDHDWTARFFGYVQDVSEEDIRRLWARILAGEVRSPGNVTLRTLSILRNMSHLEAKLFTEAMRYRIDDYIFWKFCVKSSEVLNDGDFYYRFVDMGLFYSPIEARPPRHISLGKEGSVSLVNADHILFLQGTPNKAIDEGGNKAILKTPAMEIAQYCEVTSDPAYLRHLAKQLANKNCTLQAVPIEKITRDGYDYDHGKIQTIEPI